MELYATPIEAISGPKLMMEVRFFVRLVLLRGDAELELNGKTGWVAPDSLLVRVMPENQDADLFAQEGTSVYAEICYSKDGRVIPIEARIAKRMVRSNYLKLWLDVSGAHPRLLERWTSFIQKYSAYRDTRERSSG